MDPSASLWKNPSFLKLWLAQLTANIGDQCYSFALLWYLLQATKSGTALSLLAIPEMVAGLLFYLIGGVLADRYNPRLLMVGADVARIFVAIGVGIMAAMGIEQFSFFLVAQFLLGLFSSLFQPARTVALKTVVSLEQLGRANAILDTTFRTVRIAAPMTIGLIASIVPLSALFFVNAASYLLSVVFLYAIRVSLTDTRNGPAAKMTPGQYVRDIATGVRELKKSRMLFLILLFSNMGFLVWQVCYSVGFPFLAERMQQGNGSTLAMLMGFYGVGNLLGSLYMSRAYYTKYLLVIMIGWTLQAGGFMLLAAGGAMHWVAFLGAAVAGVGGPFIGIPTVTAIQVKAGASTGKIFSINMLFFTFFSMLSSSLGAIWLGSWPVEQLFFASSLFLVVMSAAGFVIIKRTSREQHQSASL
ncbi:MFS transporter [Mesorhizobium sp. M00.F.Ca.ET.186.01.1.1]|uniref:MFS transporter n=1 Tax=Brevibacillus parabrevis TaxID=54914 RepID=UPI001134BFB3|nr:MFS transporter [Brevibacillus parabrevis]MED1725555.1 MFS transporter [Brevibacillus parabrevis]TGV17692.1 MFS transporter [Mesorhizobium sp. M00.F.Ca.ET.186.01.1.1]